MDPFGHEVVESLNFLVDLSYCMSSDMSFLCLSGCFRCLFYFIMARSSLVCKVKTRVEYNAFDVCCSILQWLGGA